ncbi:unknown protein [Lactococcus lactis subsp. lactis Il1403]|uniref:Uncharacterized protein n=1 Tax=Lactococcus lactis subsp. lactis (strain IL1403) TaxID=272623 RepID=Q9CGN1_LACLA|nr:unknown protein [Lactococcus lactis subsp. lactis Il1403]
MIVSLYLNIGFLDYKIKKTQSFQASCFSIFTLNSLHNTYKFSNSSIASKRVISISSFSSLKRSISACNSPDLTKSAVFSCISNNRAAIFDSKSDKNKIVTKRSCPVEK